ncbi:hypothetical protein, partial [Parasphingorhabdus sp.]|uniref:hypothetical protein n=1 Tax=Parasphingorhabdus sp. TaxID=2709688 RepID=UPI00329A7F99
MPVHFIILPSIGSVNIFTFWLTLDLSGQIVKRQYQTHSKMDPMTGLTNFLFAPANRPERVEKAAKSGAD